MNTKTFNTQYRNAQKRSAFADTINAFVVDDETALSALQSLHERLQTLAEPSSCPQWLWFLTNDLCDLLSDAAEYWKKPGPPWEDQ